MRFELPEAKKLTLKMVIPIRWGDMDAMGHVNNTIYFRYLEIVRIEWLHRVMGPPDAAGEGPVIVNTFCNFLKQLKYPGDVLAKHYVAKPGRSSFEAYVTLERTDEPGAACRRRVAAVGERVHEDAVQFVTRRQLDERIKMALMAVHAVR